MIASNWRFHLSLLFCFCVLLVGCSVTDEEAIEFSYDAFVTNYEQEPIEPNTERTDAAFYLPRGFDIVEETEYNILLQNGEQLYVLFHQPSEPRTSKIHLERDMEYKDESLLFETIESEEQIGYLMIKEEEDDQLHVVTAFGGAKISTLSTYDVLEDNVRAMTQIVQSYQPFSQE